MALMTHRPGRARAGAHGIIDLGGEDRLIAGLGGAEIPADDAIVFEHDGAIFTAEFDASGPTWISGGGRFDRSECAIGIT